MQLSYDYAKDRALICLRANYESHLMFKLLRLGMVPHSKLSYLATLLPSGAPVCSLMSLSGGSAWNREQNGSKAADRGIGRPLWTPVGNLRCV